MKNTILKRTIIAVMLTIGLAAAGVVAQTPRLKVTRTKARVSLNNITTKAAALQREIARNSVYDSTPNPEDRVADQLTTVTEAVSNLRIGLNQRNFDATDDVNDILDSSTRINRILTRNNTSRLITTQWRSLRTDINTLAGNYSMTWDWNQTYPGDNTGDYPNGNGYPVDNGSFSRNLTGTYRLNIAESDNVSTVIDRSLGYYANDQRDNVRRNLERRLASPEMIAIEKNGRTVSLASTNQAQVTFDADGIARSETNDRGRTITTKVTSLNNNLTIDYSGDRVNDFNVMFDVDRSGRLKVTRRIYLENRNETVTVSSVYDRTSKTADFTAVRPINDPNNTGNNGGINTGTYLIANGTTLTATLRDAISTKGTQVGDRFIMDVTAPDQYSDARIEGHVSQVASSGRVSGRANMQLDLDTISMNGRTYKFAGIIQTVTSANGDNVTVNNEGTVRDSNQGTKTATRAGIGAILGAIIGAVAGGGTGAAIGAGVGAGAGAGTVLIGGRDTIELGQGSTFSILASAPADLGKN